MATTKRSTRKTGTTKRRTTTGNKKTTRHTAKRKTTKRSTAKTTAKRKTTKRNTGTTTAKRKTTKRATAKRNTTKRTGSKRKTTKRTTSNTSACITGTFDGNIVTPGHLRIAQGSSCNANVKAGSIQVDGNFHGRAVATTNLKLGKNCKFQGEFHTDKLDACNGASFSGWCQIGSYKKAA